MAWLLEREGSRNRRIKYFKAAFFIGIGFYTYENEAGGGRVGWGMRLLLKIECFFGQRGLLLRCLVANNKSLKFVFVKGLPHTEG